MEGGRPLRALTGTSPAPLTDMPLSVNWRGGLPETDLFAPEVKHGSDRVDREFKVVRGEIATGPPGG